MNIYDKHSKAFAQVAAFVALKDGDIIRISLKYPKDGAGRLIAYVHLLGTSMVYGTASGYGYDKATAAVSAAFDQIPGFDIKNSGDDWIDQLREQGWRVIQVI